MSSLLSCLSDYSTSVASGGNTLDLSALELSELSAADFALLHQFLCNGATFEVGEGHAHAHSLQHNGAMSGGDSHSSAATRVGSSAALERIILPSFTAAGRGASVLYAFVQLLDVLEVATKCETLFDLRAIDNFHSFSNYFLMERLWTPTVLESLVEKCTKISKRLQRRQAHIFTFGVHGGGNIGLGLVAHLVTKPRRGLLRIMANAAFQPVKDALTPHTSNEAANSGSAAASAAPSASSPAWRTVPSLSVQSQSDTLPVNLLSMTGALASPPVGGGGSGSGTGAGQFQLQGQGQGSAESQSKSEIEADGVGSERELGEATWRVVATTSKMFLRHLIRAGGRIRLRHHVATQRSHGGGQQYTYTEIPNVNLVDRSLSSVRELYVKSSVLALCVTLSVFQQIRHDIAVGLLARYLHDEMPLTILVCMNGTNTEQAVRDGVFAELSTLTGDAFARRVLHGINFVECVVDRIVRTVDDDDIATQIITQVTDKFGSAAGRQTAGNLVGSPSGDLQPDSPIGGNVNTSADTQSQGWSDNDAQNALHFTTQNTGDALFELCAAAASKERVKAMMNSATEGPRLAKLLVMYGIRVAVFDAERVCSVYSRPFPEAHLLPHFSLTDDVRLYESVKNKFVNGTHYILSAMAGLSGYELMAHAIRSPFLRGFVLELMEQEIAPVLVRAFPSFAPPNPILERLKREFVLRCEENAADTVARVARDPLRKMNRGRRIRGTLELRDKYKLNTPCYRLELGYSAALLYALQSKDNDSGEKLRQVFHSAAASNSSYRAALTYSGPSPAGPFMGFHPDREADRVQRLLAMIVVLRQLASREKMAQLSLLLDLTTGHLSYQRKPSAALSTPTLSAAPMPLPPAAPFKPDRARSFSNDVALGLTNTPPPPQRGSNAGTGTANANAISQEAEAQRRAQPQPQPNAQGHAQGQDQEAVDGGALRSSSFASSTREAVPSATNLSSGMSNSSTPSSSGVLSHRHLGRSGTEELSGVQTDVALLHQVQLQMRLQQLAAQTSSTSASSGSAWTAAATSGQVGSGSIGGSGQLQSQAQSQSGPTKVAPRPLSVGSNLDSLDFGGSEQSDDRDDVADAALLLSSESPSEQASESDFARGDVISPFPAGALNTARLVPTQLIEPRSSWLARRITYELLFIRHGETFGNCGQSTRDGRIDRAAVESNTKDRTRRIFQGDVDTEINQLTAQGLKSAQQAAEQVVSEFVQLRKWMPDVVIHSPLKRAADTAKPLLDLLPNLASATVADEGLREMKFGVAENSRICDLLEAVPQGAGGGGGGSGVGMGGAADADAEYLTWRRTCHSFYQEQNAVYRFPEGESFSDVVWRVYNWLTRLESRFAGKRIVVFGHSMWGAACAMLFGRGVAIRQSNQQQQLQHCDSPLHANPQPQPQPQAQAQAQTQAQLQAQTPTQTQTQPSDEFLAFDGPHVLPHATPVPMNF